MAAGSEGDGVLTTWPRGESGERGRRRPYHMAAGREDDGVLTTWPRGERTTASLPQGRVERGRRRPYHMAAGREQEKRTMASLPHGRFPSLKPSCTSEPTTCCLQVPSKELYCLACLRPSQFVCRLFCSLQTPSQFVCRLFCSLQPPPPPPNAFPLSSTH